MNRWHTAEQQPKLIYSFSPMLSRLPLPAEKYTKRLQLQNSPITQRARRTSVSIIIIMIRNNDKSRYYTHIAQWLELGSLPTTVRPHRQPTHSTQRTKAMRRSKRLTCE